MAGHQQVMRRQVKQSRPTWQIILLTTFCVLLVVGLLVGLVVLWRATIPIQAANILVMPDVRQMVLASTVLIQLGYGGANGRDCGTDYVRQDCSLAFHFGLGTLLDHQHILTHDHLQVIGDDAGTLAEIRNYEWIKFSGYTGEEVIVPTKDIIITPESTPFGMLILQLPAQIDLSAVAMPARVAHNLSYTQMMNAEVYYPSMVMPIDSIYPYTSGDIWAKMTVGAGQVGATRVINATGFYAVAYAEPIIQMQNGDCGGGTFMLIDGIPQLVGTHNYTTASYYLFLPVVR